MLRRNKTKTKNTRSSTSSSVHKQTLTFINCVVSSYVVFSVFQCPPVLVLSDTFNILFFLLNAPQFYSLQFGIEKEGNGFLFLTEKVLFSSQSGHTNTNSSLAVRMMGSASICLLQSHLLSPGRNLSQWLYIPHVAFLGYQQQAMTPTTLKLHSSSLHSDLSLIGIPYTVQQNSSLIIKSCT